MQCQLRAQKSLLSNMYIQPFRLHTDISVHFDDVMYCR